MATKNLHIDLRRRHIERANATRPRLPKNLRQLGAVGPVTRPLPAGSQPAIVKVLTTSATTTGSHLSYLQQPGKGQDGGRASLYGPDAETEKRRVFTREAQHDPRQFRIVVSMPDHARLDRTQMIELFMTQVERDLQRPLSWVAANHYDTAHPHTHIALRGVDRNGKEFFMAKHYLTQGLRDRASQLLTWLIGPMQQQRQQQVQQTERQTLNGVVRGMEDPDSRRLQQFPQQHTRTTSPTPQQGTRAEGRPASRWDSADREMESLLRAGLPARFLVPMPTAAPSHAPQQARGTDSGQSAAPSGDLAARLETLRQRLTEQRQQGQQRGPQQEQGRGW